MVGGVPDFARSDERYEEAFREAGFDEVGSPPESLAAKIKASDIRNALLVAFDNWSFCARDPRRRRWASDVAQQAGGDTAGWRGRVRDPAIWKDEATLFKVIETAPFPEQSVALLLAIELHTDAPGKPRVAFLKRLHERHPRDFWIHGVLPSSIFGCPGHERRNVGPRPRAVYYRNRVGEDAGGVSAGPMRPIGAEPVGGRLRLPGTTADHGGPRGIGAGRRRGTGREPQESGEAPPVLVGVPLLPGTVPGPSSPGRVHRRRLRRRCRCVSRGMCRASLGDAFGRAQKLRKGGGGTFSPRCGRASARFPSHTLPERGGWTTNSVE